MKLGALLDHSFIFVRTLFRTIDVFLNLPDWMICWYIFSRYFVCFESNNSKYTLCSTLDDNTNSCKFFIGIASDCNRLEASVFGSIMWLYSWCGKQSGIMHNCFLVNFQIIGNNVLLFLYGHLFLSSLLYTRCLNDFTIYWTLWLAIVPYVDLHTLLNFLLSSRTHIRDSYPWLRSETYKILDQLIKLNNRVLISLSYISFLDLYI